MIDKPSTTQPNSISKDPKVPTLMKNSFAMPSVTCTNIKAELYKNIYPIVPSAISAPLSGKFLPKKVINKAAKKGNTTIVQANSASTPPSV